MSHDRGCWKCDADTMSDKFECFNRIGSARVKAPFFTNQGRIPHNPHMTGHRRLFCDLDGCLADFDRHYQETFGKTRIRHSGWKDIAGVKHFFRHIPPMSDMDHLWSAILPLRPIILTGIPTSINAASNDKITWVRKNLGLNVPVICCRAKEKWFYCHPGDILIDDTPEYQPLWENAGGIWVHHISADQTIDALKLLGIL